jgi:hypothetical protein
MALEASGNCAQECVSDSIVVKSSVPQSKLTSLVTYVRILTVTTKYGVVVELAKFAGQWVDPVGNATTSE